MNLHLFALSICRVLPKREPQAHGAASPSSLLQPVAASCYTQSGRNKLTYFGWLAGLNKQLLPKGS